MRNFYVLAAVVVLGGAVWAAGARAQTTSTASSTPKQTIPAVIRVSVDQLKTAGFTKPVAVAPTSSRYLAPTFYFRVGEKISTNGWGDADNLVSVLIKPISDVNWVYGDGQLEIRDIAGKTQARISRPGYYMVITGPDKNKVSTLANNLKVLY